MINTDYQQGGLYELCAALRPRGRERPDWQYAQASFPDSMATLSGRAAGDLTRAFPLACAENMILIWIRADRELPCYGIQAAAWAGDKAIQARNPSGAGRGVFLCVPGLDAATDEPRPAAAPGR